MKSFQLAAAVIFATTSMATAQDNVKISYSGVLTVENLSGSEFSDDFFYGNGDVSFRWATASDLNFGVDLGIETFGLLSSENSYYDLSAYYVSGIIDGQFGRFSFGMPRGIMGDYFSVPAVAGSELFNLEVAFLGTDLFRFLKLSSAEFNENMYGIRYDGKIGQLDVAGSISKFNEVSGNIGEVVALYDAGQWSVVFGASIMEIDGSSANSTTIEVKGHSGKFSGGLAYNKSDLLSLNSGSGRAFISYDVNDAAKVNAHVLNYQFDGNSSELLYSLDFSYKHKTGAFFNVGVVTSETIDKIVNVSLGYKF